MNGINRRGQKVVCVIGMVLDAEPVTAIPQVGKTYTVDDFVPTGVLGGEGCGHPGITLVEFPPNKCFYCNKFVGWPLVAFRPVVEDKPSAEVAELLQLITDAPPLEKPALAPLIFWNGGEIDASWPGQ